MSKTKNALEYTLRAHEAAGREAAFMYETTITGSGLVSYTLKRTLDKGEYALERFA